MMHQPCEPAIFIDGWHCDWDCPYLPYNTGDVCLYVGHEIDWWDFWIAECKTMIKEKDNEHPR